jgi:2-polyprenyl-6-methoxyphenol hydroxylase-like FAD-dependent oxidoreductase
MPSSSALVIGGSLAGMCAARVLSDAFDKVTIIERDAYPSAPGFRPGVPQARHVHNLLARGLREFESFFPGFEARMRERGAVPVETGWDTATLWPHGWARRAHTGLWQLYASRPVIEGTVLEFCRSLPHVTFVEGTEVSALRAAGGSRPYCTGVEVRTRDDRLLSGLWLGMCADARAEATTTPKQSAYPRVQDPAATRDKPAMTADEQAKLKKDLIEARDRQSSKAKQGATRPQPIKP